MKILLFHYYLFLNWEVEVEGYIGNDLHEQ